MQRRMDSTGSPFHPERSRRRGFSLTEMLVVIAILTIISIALAGVFTTVITDIPRSYRVIQTNTTVLNMLERMRQDISAATRLGEGDAQVLLIEMSDGVISYQIKDDKVLRCNLSGLRGSREIDDNGYISRDDEMTAACPERSRGDNNEVKDATVWSVPHAKINWQVWRENGKGYAVQVKTHIEHKVRGHLEKKMANSHLYFVGAFSRILR